MRCIQHPPAASIRGQPHLPACVPQAASIHNLRMFLRSVAFAQIRRPEELNKVVMTSFISKSKEAKIPQPLVLGKAEANN